MSGKAQARLIPEQPKGYRLIPLTRGQVSLVSVRNYEKLFCFNWMAHWNPGTESFYAVRHSSRKDGRGDIAMHREVLGLSRDDPREGEHRNPGKTLDNRRSNLRIATHSQNVKNARKRRDNTSGFKGVSRDQSGKWRAQIGLDGERIYLGLFPSPFQAYLAYCDASRKMHGEFGRIA